MDSEKCPKKVFLEVIFSLYSEVSVRVKL